MAVIFDNVDFSYVKKKRKLPVLRNVSFSVADREKVAIVGASGSGKSTILDLIAGVYLPEGGAVTTLGKKLRELSETDRAHLRRTEVGYVFQDFKLFNHLTALDNVAVAAQLAGVKRSDSLKSARELLERVGLAHRIEHLPTELSGGERQRVAIARALVNQPTIVLADEPTGALDAGVRDEILDLLLDVTKDASLVVVTHDPEVAERLADRTVLCRDGQIVAA